jgi:hypothetical protein
MSGDYPVQFLEVQIQTLSGSTTKRLDDAALELQVDLELWRVDEEERNANLVPYDPYLDFVSFATAIAGEPWDEPYSALAGLTEPQLRLVAAWNFLTISREILRPDMAPPRWSDAERVAYSKRHRAAAERLVDEVQRTKPATLH